MKSTGTIGRGISRVAQLQKYAADSGHAIVCNNETYQLVAPTMTARLIPVDVVGVSPCNKPKQRRLRDITPIVSAPVQNIRSEVLYKVCTCGVLYDAVAQAICLYRLLPRSYEVAER